MAVLAFRHCAWLLTLLVGAGLTGCAAAGSSAPKEPAYRIVNGATYVPVGTADREYSREAATLQLAPGRTWPEHPLAKTKSGTPEWYQIGYARQAADRFWFCSWASVAIKTSDARARRAAVDTLQGMLKLYYYTDALDPPSRPQLIQELTSAKRGDLTALRNDLQLNC